jgi:pyrophosphatase PpaX
MPEQTRNPAPAVLFDLDGTLIDTIELILSSARHAFGGWPRATPTDEEWVRGIGTPLVTQLRAYAETEDEVALLLDRYRAYQHVHHDRLTRCYDDVPAEVARLSGRGHPLAVVTSKASAIAARSLAHVGLDRYFDAVIGYDETERHKPDPEPVLAGLAKLRVPATRAVYVGDSPHDIHAGNAAGVVTIAVTWGPFGRETLAAAGPNHFIECMADLPGVLAQVFGP